MRDSSPLRDALPRLSYLRRTMSKTDWGSPPDSPTHASDIFDTSEAVAAQPPAPDVAPAADELAAEQPPAPEQPPALQVSMEMQLKHEALKAQFKEAYDKARADALL